jgi:DNA-binding LytR/AlgR family response regulator
MNALEKRLEADQFVRIHRALLVNARKIREIVTIGEGEYEILVGRSRLKSSRRYRRAVSALLRPNRT